MTQQTLDAIIELKTLDQIYQDEIRRLRQEQQDLLAKQDRISIQIQNLCDCQLPHGTSSWLCGVTYSQCSICGRTDL